MQLFIDISVNPSNNIPRRVLVDDFRWSIHDNYISVPCRIYHVTSSGDLDGTIPFRVKDLPVSNEFMVDPATGGVIVGYDPEVHTTAVPQLDYMLALTVAMVGAIANTRISEIIINLIRINILEADGRGIFN